MTARLLQQKSVVSGIYSLVSAIKPIDILEEQHIEETLAWLQSGAPIFRVKKA
ncbi:hypothetical protein [Piscirickettsia litoralis]|uniref:hypothetical protein n=1 Tax=Piscirickettsia litoralis TaxID=1891921 RepID=UPI0019146C88|nr:hypothetical protein [Piscirickettsia litoralis]